MAQRNAHQFRALAGSALEELAQRRNSAVTAILGPTNTGKTHHALSRMMAHKSGIMGFPLRLLARENYERLKAVKGAGKVALLTGEEKIVPPGAQWFACTVEAMPLERAVDFIGIDEIQLAADPERGHVFTDRLLHARGRSETLFLGAETMRPMLQKLIPGITVETRPRLSQLVHAGHSNLGRLPARSAIVAFSAHEVYSLAEAIRQRRGGCAVIMGRLSPRTRNAQIELYQNRDVDYLVATDAIGMGLNMDVDHVALASMRKFDGQFPRHLSAQEIAQIAGRAGRGMKDGTFGTTHTCPPMAPSLADTIEEHRFEAVEKLHWRQSALEFANPQALLRSLRAKPPRPELKPGRPGSDLEVLQTLAREQAIMERARGRRETALLWEACQIPDFRKMGDQSHAQLCGRIFKELLEKGRLPTAWIQGHLKALDQTEGDIDMLMNRLSGVRVWAYVTARAGWTAPGSALGAQSQAVEERLSDALHERLTARFVNRRAAVLMRREGHDDAAMLHAVTATGAVVVEGHEIGQLEGFAFNAANAQSRSEHDAIAKAGHRAAREAMGGIIKRFLEDGGETIALVESGADRVPGAGPENGASALQEQPIPPGTLTWRGAPVARLVKGEGFFAPTIKLLRGDFSDPQQEVPVRERLQGWLADYVRQRLRLFWQGLEQLRQQSMTRGLAHRLAEDGGVTVLLGGEGTNLRTQARALKSHGFAFSTALGVEGQGLVWHESLLKPAVAGLMSLLGCVWEGAGTAPQPMAPGRFWVEEAQRPPWPGWVKAGPVALRLDQAERVLQAVAKLRPQPGQRHVPLPADITRRLALKATMAPDVLAGLGVPLRLLGDLPVGALGAPAPPLIRIKPSRPGSSHPGQAEGRARHSNAHPPAKRRGSQGRLEGHDPASPFAALAGLTLKTAPGKGARKPSNLQNRPASKRKPAQAPSASHAKRHDSKRHA
ncbi:DNA helicase [Formicincola oecophyllae]|uniref:DNA helicase n=1 Tax=Formicincola oecophyllae TaxID=2558361 RepID=A0A4Y6UBT4_9PROT|nr:DEAD/DEAH box helicase [Formicincola oecophyllae]QDH13936.1 DNA helicase [Formicincola oecophyllae]